MPPLLIQLRFCFLISAFSFTFGILFPYETVPSRGRQVAILSGDNRRNCALVVSGPSQGRQVAIPKIFLEVEPLCELFPAPLEVDRQLYNSCGSSGYHWVEFPSPLEVDRELYRTTSIKLILGMGSRPLPRQIGSYTKHSAVSFQGRQFPSPLEVDRYLY